MCSTFLLVTGGLIVAWLNVYFLMISGKAEGNLLTSLPTSAYSLFCLRQVAVTLSKINELEVLRTQKMSQQLLSVDTVKDLL